LIEGERVVGKTGVTDFFDAFAEEYSFLAQTHDQRHYDEVLSLLPPHANRALDAGCGSGGLTLRLAKHARYVVGIDISRSMIALAKKRQAEQRRNNVGFVIGDLESLPFGEETFDFGVSYGALHLTRLDVTLPGLRGLIAPGGRMLLHDWVTSKPRLHTFAAWHVFVALMSVPGHARAYGLHTMWRSFSFRISPAYLRHVRNTALLTPEAFQDTYSRFLPGCKFERSGWEMVAFWKAPGKGKPGPGWAQLR